MTTNFGTDNIYYVPKEEKLSIYDIHGWRRIDMDVHSYYVFMNEKYLWGIGEKLLEIAEGQEIDKDLFGRFMAELRAHHLERGGSNMVEEALLPQEIVMWVRISDVAQESFSAEDYEERKKVLSDSVEVPIYGSMFLSSLRDYELSLPFEGGQEAFVLELPLDGGINVAELGREEFLPIIDEYCGQGGYSNRGNIVNYTMKGGLSKENLGGIPLFKVGENYFVTLYLHIRTPLRHRVSLSVRDERAEEIPGLIEGLGFETVKENSGNWIYRKGGDVVHYYGNAAGKESLGSRFVSPLIIVISAGGKGDGESRSKLRDELKERLAKK